MAIFHAGGELDSFIPLSSNVRETTDSGRFDPALCRCAISTSINTGTASDIFRTPDLPNLTFLFHHFSAYVSSPATHNGVIVYRNSANAAVFRISRITSTQWQPQYFDAATLLWVNIGGAFTFAATVLGTFDVRITCGNGGGFEIKLQSVIVSSGTFITNDVNNIRSIEYCAIIGAVSIQNIQFSQHIVADEDTVNMRLYTTAATAAGANSAWTGTVADINEIALNDLTFISSTVANQVSGFTRAGLTLPAGAIKAVAVSARASLNPGGPQNLQHHLRVGGTDYFGPNVPGLISGFRPCQTLFTINPATGLPWTTAEAAAATWQFGVRSIA